jgi:hypothetical protein
MIGPKRSSRRGRTGAVTVTLSAAAAILLAGCGGSSHHAVTSNPPATTAPRGAGDAGPRESGTLALARAHYANAPAGEQTSPATSPQHGGVQTRFLLTLQTKDRLGAEGKVRRAYRIVLVGPRPRCTLFTAVAAAARGTRLQRTLSPPDPMGWCAGTYHGVIVLDTSPSCAAASSGAPQCGRFTPRHLAVGRFTFTTG